MSRAVGEVRIMGNTVGWFLYNGTIDYADTPVYKTREAFNEQAWYHEAPDTNKKCTCDNTPTSVTLYADYGSGIEWASKVCFWCMVIVGEMTPYPEERRGEEAD